MVSTSPIDAAAYRIGVAVGSRDSAPGVPPNAAALRMVAALRWLSLS